jgi:drug/metabolite transporter (DMT)-like permease
MTEGMTLRRIGAAIFACLLWSTAFTGVKIGLKYAPPLGFAGIRFTLSGIILMFLAGGIKNYITVLKNHLNIILKVAFFQTLLVYSLFYTGMTIVSGALAAIVIGSSPLNTALVAHFTMHNDRMTWQKTISIAIGILGIVIIAISRKPWSMDGLIEFLGIMILLASSFSGAFANVLVAKDKKAVPPLILASAQLFIGGLALMIISIPLEGFLAFQTFPLEFYLALLWLSILSAAAFTIWFSLLKKPGVKVSDLNLWKFIIPVFGAILSWIILPDESPSLFPVIGMICVTLAIIAYYYCVNYKKSACRTGITDK